MPRYIALENSQPTALVCPQQAGFASLNERSEPLWALWHIGFKRKHHTMGVKSKKDLAQKHKWKAWRKGAK
jgi:hypothetical protein